MLRHKYLLSIPLLFFIGWAVHRVGVTGLLGVPEVLAAADTSSEDFLNTLSYFMSVAITGMNVIMWVLFRLLDIVLDPYFIFDLGANGSDGPLLMMLHEIWQLMRDLVNVVFAILLVLGAIITIVKANTETVKNYRVKFILAVVLVNFSWFIPRVVLDVSQVLTYTIFQLPGAFRGGANEVKCTVPVSDENTGQISYQPCMIVTDVKFLEDAEGITEVKGNTKGWKCPMKDILCFYQEAFNDNPTVWTHSSIINGLIVNHAHLAVLANISQPAPAAGGNQTGGEVRELITFLIRLLLVFLIHVALFFPMLAMVVAFFVRIPILWVTMAFMPLAAIGFVIGDKMGEMDTVKKIWKRFLSAAFLPVLVAIPITIGFIMVNAGANTPAPKGIQQLNGFIPVLAGVKDIWQILWLLLAIVILWTEVFNILNKDEIIGKFTQPIEQFGKGIGKFALKAPLAAPIIPAPGGKGNLSPLQVMGAANPNRLNALLDDGRLDSSDMDRLFNRGGSADPKTAAKGRETINKNLTVKADIKTILDTKKLDELDDKPTAKKIVDDVAAKLRGYKEVRDDPALMALKPEQLVDELVAKNPDKFDAAELEKIKKALQNYK